MTLTLTRPDDWHLHLRDGDALKTTVAATARQFGRAIVMPNLKPPVTNAAEAMAYKARILDARPEGSDFEPLMTIYLTDRTTPQTIAEAKAAGVVAAKLYPAGATTNSDSGVTDLPRLDDTLRAMAEHGMLLLIHGEVTHGEVDIFERERVFLDEVLKPLIARFDDLKIVMEHITTAAAARFITDAPERVGATITAHHLLVNRNAMLAGGIRPHYYCLPILKREEDRKALLAAATSGNPKFFLGTDSAPHAISAKESVCGCAGCYTAHAALELYAEAFEEVDALDRLEAFASFHGADFYGLPRNSGTITLERASWKPPQAITFADTTVRPFRADQALRWCAQSPSDTM